MKKIEAETELEYLETSEEAKTSGLRRIKRRHFTEKGATGLKNCQVIFELKIDGDLFKFLETEAKKKGEESVNNVLNGLLRETIERKQIREELLNDKEFVSRLKEKLAA